MRSFRVVPEEGAGSPPREEGKANVSIRQIQHSFISSFEVVGTVGGRRLSNRSGRDAESRKPRRQDYGLRRGCRVSLGMGYASSRGSGGDRSRRNRVGGIVRKVRASSFAVAIETTHSAPAQLLELQKIQRAPALCSLRFPESEASHEAWGPPRE